MNYTIGIPAHNEERTLPSTLASIMAQDLPSGRYNIVVVPNGCKDKTTQAALAFGALHWGKPECQHNQGRANYVFRRNNLERVFTVVEATVADKSEALNVVHAEAQGSEVVFCIDADVHLGKNLVKRVCAEFERNPLHGAVAVRYRGLVPERKRTVANIMDAARVAVCRAINHFDEHLPRLDGKCFAYRHNLINSHAHLIPSDTWLEGIAWQHSAGCLYLDDVHIEYFFPDSFLELCNQYARYLSTKQLFKRTYPHLSLVTQRGRNRSTPDQRTVQYKQRVLGWCFFRAVSLYAAAYHSHIDLSGGASTWPVIKSTKGWS